MENSHIKSKSGIFKSIRNNKSAAPAVAAVAAVAARYDDVQFFE